MKKIFLILLLTLASVGYSFHKRRHKNKTVKQKLWKRHYTKKKKHEIKGQYPEKEKERGDNGDINVTRIFDHVSKYQQFGPQTENGEKRSTRGGQFSPGLWQFDTAGNDDVKLLVSDVSKTAADIVKGISSDDSKLLGPDSNKGKTDIVNGVRRSDCVSLNNCLGGINGMISNGHSRFNQYNNEVFMPGDEKTFSEPMNMLHHHDNGPFHHYENGGNPLIGGLAHGSSIVTHQIDYQTSPRQVYMHGIEKTQRKSYITLLIHFS